MFAIGEQLYRLTPRDEETLLLEPYFRRIDVSIAGASASGFGELFFALDRTLFLKSVVYEFNAVALANWTGFQLISSNAPGNFIHYIDGLDAGAIAGAASPVMVSPSYPAAPAVGSGVMWRQDMSMLVPAGASRIRFTAYRNNTVNVATASCWLTGYLIPPGGIGRGG